VLLPPGRRFDLLAVLGDLRPMQALLTALSDLGFTVDVVKDAAAARTAFFSSGGHHCVVFGPDVTPGVAGAIARSLREVDPALPALSYGPRVDNQGQESRTESIGLHPGSRAGQGALLRFLAELPERG
jgi:hypothetical protein